MDLRLKLTNELMGFLLNASSAQRLASLTIDSANCVLLLNRLLQPLVVHVDVSHWFLLSSHWQTRELAKKRLIVRSKLVLDLAFLLIEFLESVAY